MRFAGFLGLMALAGCSGTAVDGSQAALEEEPIDTCAVAEAERMAAADPCDGQPDNTPMGCGYGTNKDGNVVAGSVVCKGGKKFVEPCPWPGDVCRISGRRGRGYCFGPPCNPNGFAPFCSGNVLVSC